MPELQCLLGPGAPPLPVTQQCFFKGEAFMGNSSLVSAANVVSSAHPSHHSPLAIGMSFFSKSFQAAKRADLLSVSVCWSWGNAYRESIACLHG